MLFRNRRFYKTDYNYISYFPFGVIGRIGYVTKDKKTSLTVEHVLWRTELVWIFTIIGIIGLFDSKGAAFGFKWISIIVLVAIVCQILIILTAKLHMEPYDEDKHGMLIPNES